MPVPITAIYAAILALILTVLSAKAGLLRGKLGIPAGAGDNAEMTLAMRRHGNAAEYIPIAIILMMILEMKKTLKKRKKSFFTRSIQRPDLLLLSNQRKIMMRTS